MVTMSSNWDRTTDVMAGRSGMLTRIAVTAILLPAIVRIAIAAFLVPGVALGTIGVAITIALFLVTLWGQLAITAVATHPGTTQSDAGRQALNRLAAMVGVTLVGAIVIGIVFVPLGIAIARSGVDIVALGNGANLAALPPGTASFAGLYLVVVTIIGLFVAARLLLLNAVVLNERRGIGAYVRSWRLTRGLAWRLVGVFLLFVVVLTIATSAAQFVTAIVFRLLMASASVVPVFLGAVAGAIVQTILTVVATVFAAQLYVATAEREAVDPLA